MIAERTVRVDKNGTYYFDEWKVHYNYWRTIGSLRDPEALDYSFDVRHDRKRVHDTIQIWVDRRDKTLKITAGAWHDDPVNKEILDLIIDFLGLEDYTIKHTCASPSPASPPLLKEERSQLFELPLEQDTESHK